MALRVDNVLLAPLDLAQCTQLLIQRVGRDSELIRRRALEFHTKTGGNP